MIFGSFLLQKIMVSCLHFPFHLWRVSFVFLLENLFFSFVSFFFSRESVEAEVLRLRGQPPTGVPPPPRPRLGPVLRDDGRVPVLPAPLPAPDGRAALVYPAVPLLLSPLLEDRLPAPVRPLSPVGRRRRVTTGRQRDRVEAPVSFGREVEERR